MKEIGLLGLRAGSQTEEGLISKKLENNKISCGPAGETKKTRYSDILLKNYVLLF
jgi:hypothetical protein